MSDFVKITEMPSPYRHQEKMSVKEIITHINDEDKTVAFAVEKAKRSKEKNNFIVNILLGINFKNRLSIFFAFLIEHRNILKRTVCDQNGPRCAICIIRIASRYHWGKRSRKIST